MGICFCDNFKTIPKSDILISIPSNDKEIGNSIIVEKRETRIVKQFLKVKTLKQSPSEFQSKNPKGNRGEISTECYIKMKSQKVPMLKQLSILDHDGWKEKEVINNQHLLLKQSPIEKNPLFPTATTTQLISTTTTTPTNNNDEMLQQSQQDISNVLISEEEEERLKTFFKEHYLFHFFNAEYIQSIIDELPGFLLESDSFIFKEGDESMCFFLIKSGKCLLISGNETCELNEFESFGELAISYANDPIRIYSIKTLTDVEIFWIDASFYQSLRQTINHLPLIEDILISFDNIMLFNYIPNESKERLASLVSYNKLKKGTKFIAKNSKLNKDSIYIISQGQLCLKLSNGYIKYLYRGSVINANQVLLFCNREKKKYEIETSEDTVCFAITKSAFIEVFGLAFQRSLLFQCFTKTITQNSFLSQLMAKAGIELDNLYKAFQIKEYSANAVVYCKSAALNKKYIFIFEGELINSKNNAPVCNKGRYYGDDIALRNEEYVNILLYNLNLILSLLVLNMI